MSYASLFSGFPSNAQLWIYPTRQLLGEQRRDQLLNAVRAFLSTWRSHGTPVTAAAEVLDDRFLVIAAYVEGDHVSGCGIDASTRVLKDAASGVGIEWEDALNVQYRSDSGTVESVSRLDFKRLARNAAIDSSVFVFDPSLTTVGELREGAFERPASESWHRRYFDQAVPAGS